MVAPSIIAAEAPYNGETWLGLVEECLRERGMTNSAYAATDATLTAASASQVAQAKKCVQRALVYLQTCRSEWWSLSEADATAETPFTRVLLPTDFGTLGKGGVFIAGVRLAMLSAEEYAANVRPDSDGGGVLCAEISGPPTHGRLVMVNNTEASVVYYRWALDVFPRQAAAWTAHVLYNATAKAITTDIVVRVPVALQTILADLIRMEWRKMVGDAKGAATYKTLADVALEDVRETPGDQMVLRAKAGLPTENTQRRW